MATHSQRFDRYMSLYVVGSNEKWPSPSERRIQGGRTACYSGMRRAGSPPMGGLSNLDWSSPSPNLDEESLESAC